ncbi:Uncharacterized conserved protein YqhQ [Caloranaerobacter azorensis DSM 13643]|uniref:Uncharacterized conserved protein YqhQ n=1 Tax=Caloranaerobacter azorensis DSM 13643 TaxID=1121264 RepID=A0A1M5SJH2_9FIRM|nr:DUF1385 domain-containing protein [Caloranaerobacter azorensis]SHH38641.1 Uncharacterized conserved protein YqhQ [Caloranaerobacter azorensis DSM 13643]
MISKIKDAFNKPKHKTSIGGQALIEGVMMKGPKEIAIAVREPNGNIKLKKEPVNSVSSKYSFLKLPFIRGSVVLIEAMIVGVKSLMYSAEVYEVEEEEPGVIDKALEKVFKDKTEDIMIYLSVILSLFFTILLFILAPSYLTNFLKTKISSNLGLNLVEGVIRVLIFLIYVYSISKMKDVKRVFEYHGAEHKTIHCYEHGEELTVENARKYTTLHPRCGTSFIFMVMIVSILVFSLFGWPNPLLRFILRIILLPVIAGISYEINKYTGRSDSKLAQIVSYPGLMLQKITTSEPDDLQLEVAIEALKGVLVEDKEADIW